jgi:hypothetical protein
MREKDQQLVKKGETDGGGGEGALGKKFSDHLRESLIIFAGSDVQTNSRKK